jgi:hypothetical protein
MTLNRSAIVITPQQPFLDWLHATDPTSIELTLLDMTRDPAVYLIPECDSDEDVLEILRNLCEHLRRAAGGLVYRDISLAARSEPRRVPPLVRFFAPLDAH